jgi:hypothetical protein
MPFYNVGTQFQKKLCLVLPGGTQVQIAGNVLKELDWGQEWIEDVCKCHVGPVQNIQKATDDHGLSRAYLSCQHDEPLAPFYAVIKRSQSLIMSLRRKQERGIRRDIERITLQIVETLVHEANRASN